MAGTLAKIGNFIAGIGKALVNNPIFKAVKFAGSLAFGPGLALVGALALSSAWLVVKAGEITHTKVFKKFGGVDKAVEANWASALEGVEGSFKPMFGFFLSGFIGTGKYLVDELAERQNLGGWGDSQDGDPAGNYEALQPDDRQRELTKKNVAVIDKSSPFGNLSTPATSPAQPLAGKTMRPKTHGAEIGG